MGLIREPKGVDFIVGPSILTDKDKKIISKIITDYKRTGKLPSAVKKQTQLRGRKSSASTKSIANGAVH